MHKPNKQSWNSGR